MACNENNWWKVTKNTKHYATSNLKDKTADYAMYDHYLNLNLLTNGYVKV